MRNHTQTQTTLTKTLCRSLILVALTLIAGSAFAADLTVSMDQPVAVADHVFDAGRVELAPASQANLQAVLINGREVALIFRHAADRLPDGGDATFLFRQDEQGVAHLMGVQWTDPVSGRQQRRLFRVAAVVSSSRPVPTMARLGGSSAR